MKRPTTAKKKALTSTVALFVGLPAYITLLYWLDSIWIDGYDTDGLVLAAGTLGPVVLAVLVFVATRVVYPGLEDWFAKREYERTARR